MIGKFIHKDLIFQDNYYIYGNNNPVKYGEPFGLYGRWIQPFLPSPSGSIWMEDRDRCDDPAYAEDCFSECGSDVECVVCCQEYCKDKNYSDGLNSCVIICIYI